MGPAVGKHKNTEKQDKNNGAHSPGIHTHVYTLISPQTFPQNTSMGTAVNEIQKMEKKEYIF
jgi:hypothetical protein